MRITLAEERGDDEAILTSPAVEVEDEGNDNGMIPAYPLLNGKKEDDEAILTSTPLEIEDKGKDDGTIPACPLLAEERSDDKAILISTTMEIEGKGSDDGTTPAYPLLDLLASQYPPPSGQLVTPQNQDKNIEGSFDLLASQFHQQEIYSTEIESTRTEVARILAKSKVDQNLDLASTRTEVTQTYDPISVERSNSGKI